MSFLELAKKRYSCRSYKDQQVEQEKLDLILEAARIAPTGKNLQGQKMVLVRTKEGMERLAKACRPHGAPMAIIVCYDRENVYLRVHDNKTIEDIDGTIVADHMVLEATDLGLGTCWICAFKPQILREEFNIPKEYVPVAIIAVGYADGEPKPDTRYDEERKGIEDLIVMESF